MAPRLYEYVGPPALRVEAANAPGGTSIEGPASLEAALDALGDHEPLTFVVSRAGVLRLASRGSEHVACAEGGPVLAAGELRFSRCPLAVVEVTNQSTGFCPEPESFPAVRAALERAGLAAPPAYTAAFTFRRCERCTQTNLVKDDDFTCAVCSAELPRRWNFASAPFSGS